MRLEIEYEPDNEEILIIMDDSVVLKATLGDKNSLILNNNFANLEEQDPELYKALRQISMTLLELKDV